QSSTPTRSATDDAELEAGAEGIDAGGIRLGQGDGRLRENQGDVPLEPVLQSLSLVRSRVAARTEIDVDLVAANLDRKPAEIVRPLVERATGAQVEASVVPVAGEDSVGDGPAVEREAHVRTTVVDRVHLVTVCKQAEHVAVDMGDKPSRVA